MPSATVTSKGQITIPIEVRQDLGLETGDRVDFVRNELTGKFEIIPGTVSLMSLFGVLPKPGKTVTIEEMNETIRQRGASADGASTE